MQKKDWFSEFGDFIGFHFLANCLGIPLLCIAVIVGLIFSKVFDMDGFEKIIFGVIIIATIIVIGVQAFDIITCYTFPEKAIYDYIYWNRGQKM